MNNENNPFKILHDFGAVNADASKKLMQLEAGEKYMLLKMELIDSVGLPAHAANYAKIQAKLDGALMAEWSTETGQEGSLGADAWAKAPEGKVLLEAGSSAKSLIAAVDVVGTGALGGCSLVLTLSKV